MHRAMASVLAVAATGVLLILPTAPASATVHEIVGQWCSGQDPLEPPGISGGSNADNFAKPLNATGFIDGVVPFRDGLLVNFDFDHPASKVVGTGVFVQIGVVDGLPLYLQLIEPDPRFPAFKHCPRLAGG